MQDDDLYIVFNIDENEASTTFGYILKQANEYNYFNPKLTNSELFELYETIMVNYSGMFDYHYDMDDVAGNMELLFNSKDYLTEEATYFIDGVFGEYMEVTMFLETNNDSATVLLDNTEEGSIILRIDSAYSGKEGADEVVDTRKEKAPNVFTGTAQEVFNMYDSLLTLEKARHPENFIDYNLQLNGLTPEETFSLKRQMVLAIDIVKESFPQNEPINWFDVHMFLYNANGNSKDMLVNYLKSKQNEHYYNFHKTFEDGSDIRKMVGFVNKIAPKEPSSVEKFTLEEQWLFSYTQQMKNMVLIINGGELNG